MGTFSKMLGLNGFVYATTGTTTGSFDAIVINEDAVFTSIKVDGVEYISTFGISGKTIKSGMYLPSPELKGYITSFTLSSGSVLAYVGGNR